MKASLTLIFVAMSSLCLSTSSSLVELGKGTYTWWGISIYNASLWGAQPFNGDYGRTRPLRLNIRYLMDIEGEELVETTMDEWLDLELDKTTECQDINRWEKQLNKIWPDIKEGDQLTLDVMTTGESIFLFNEQPIGRIKDPFFAGCFLAIWLHEATNAPALREQLLGLQ
ncbi:chalcone isomerase family protein [Pleionea sp. CnH1-48]|uniref:chalcone isomerase family protein n=1 Tax=Pleionea sp. CnH1-48 TaxID=2954494 RepID=UPI0020980125|nr:chalcone isomerase family protein [Pleionea sp. CnH1-48]MCO7226920.1 chalcone isomerase family protein [Pleionea sp. CnH1-48]